MALKKDFYSEIFEKEQKWIELMDKNLLNSVYCKFSLQPFYETKKLELVREYTSTKSEIIKNLIIIINQILSQIEMLYKMYLDGQNTNMNTLIPLFLSSQMSNTLKVDDNKPLVNSEVDKLQIKKQILENKLSNYYKSETEEDYVYDDFPEETRKIK